MAEKFSLRCSALRCLFTLSSVSNAHSLASTQFYVGVAGSVDVFMCQKLTVVTVGYPHELTNW